MLHQTKIGDRIEIKFSSFFENRKRILFGFLSFGLFGSAFIQLKLVLPSVQPINLAFFIFVLIICALFLAAFKLLIIAFQKEIINLNPIGLEIIYANLFYKKSKIYKKEFIFNLVTKEILEAPTHELKVGPIDALGFDGRQKVINATNYEGKLSFTYMELK